MGATVKAATVLRVFRTLAALVVCLVIAAGGEVAAQEEPLYPHAELEGGPWGYIDRIGKVVIPLKYDFVWPFSEGLAGVKLKGKYGFIDPTGRFAIEPQFDWGQSFKNGHASVQIGKMWGIIDRSGFTIVPPIYAATWSYSEDRAVVAAGPEFRKSKFGAVDPAGRFVIEPQYDWLDQFSEGLAVARRDGKTGYIDRDGKVAVPFQFERASPFQSGRAAVFGGPDGKSGLIDRSGAFVATFEFSSVAEFSEGLAVISIKGPGPDKRYGVIDADGSVTIPPRFVHIGHQQWAVPDAGASFRFLEGLLPVSEGKEKFGYIDRHGRYVIEPQFSRASGFQNGLAAVLMPAKIGLGDPDAEGLLAGLIDRSGQLVTPPVYDWIKIAPGRPPQVKFGKRLGYLDAKGQPLTFSHKDIEDHLKQKRDALNPPPPPPGTAIMAKAGEFPYYLRLPAGLCALDPNVPGDRKILDDLAAKAANAKVVGQVGPSVSAMVEEMLKAPETIISPQAGLFADCAQMQKLRADGDLKALGTFGTAAGLAGGMHKGRPDPSASALMVYMGAGMCASADKNGQGAPLAKNSGAPGRVADAFKRLEAGERPVLGGLVFNGLACHSAALEPAAGKVAASFHTMLFLPGWLIYIVTRDDIEASPEAFFQKLERVNALSRSLVDANAKQ